MKREFETHGKEEKEKEHEEEKEKVEKMVRELEKQKSRRGKFSRRRRVNTETTDVDFVSERNRRFNMKIARTYDAFTSQVKGDVERGTSL